MLDIIFLVNQWQNEILKFCLAYHYTVAVVLAQNRRPPVQVNFVKLMKFVSIKMRQAAATVQGWVPYKVQCKHRVHL